jgi:hypothetical protein
MDTEPGQGDRIGGDVRSLLARAPAYIELPDDVRARLAADMTRVVEHLADRDWLTDAPPELDSLRELVKSVDFPDFVAALIEGVFKAIVDSSIQQMEAFAELLASVTKALNDFVEENVSDDKSRDRLEDRYPPPSGGEAAAPAAKRGLARQRQQQLATMVLMGINRIVVTSGK